MRIGIVGPTHPYKGGIAQHTTELAHRLAARGHDVRLHSWSAQYPARLYPGEQRVAEPEMEPFGGTDYPLAWWRPDSWLRLGRRLRHSVDAVVVVVVTPVQAPAYLGMLAGLGALSARAVDLEVRVGYSSGLRHTAGVEPPDHVGSAHRATVRSRHADIGTGGEAGDAGDAEARTEIDGEASRRRRGSRQLRPPVLALCHNVLPHERRAVDEPLVRAVLRRASAVLVHTPAEAELARSLTPRPVTVAAMATHLWTADRLRPPAHRHPGPPAQRMPTPDRAAGSAPEAPVSPGDGGCRPVRRRLLFFGLVRPYKGLDVLLRALAAGPAEVALTVAGEFWGGVEPTRALVTELGLADRVELRPGYVPAGDVPALFAAADALVLPYRSGTASQNVDLAHLHGLPVVASRVGALADAVTDGVDGLLVPPEDVDALAAALHRLYEPGMLATLRAKVVLPDTDEAWSAYLDATITAVRRR